MDSDSGVSGSGTRGTVFCNYPSRFDGWVRASYGWPTFVSRASFYIDGLNLYYGALRGTRYRWLNLYEFCRSVAGDEHSIERIRYFTSDVKNTPNDSNLRSRQLIYFRALDTLGRIVTIHKGRFTRHVRLMELVSPICEVGKPEPTRSVHVFRTEEKGSDVNLATYLMLDASQRRFQTAYVVSNDTDLVEPIRIVRKEFGRPVHVINPHSDIYTRRMRNASTSYIPLDRALLAKCQFSKNLVDPKGVFRRPRDWD